MIAVTGASGLLGSYLVKELAASTIPFFGLKRSTSDTSPIDSGNVEWRDTNILDIGALQDSMKGASIVIHTAALVSFKAGDRDALFKVNVEGTRNVVNTCLSLGIPRLIHISSVAALGRQKGVSEITENNKWVDNNLNSDYAESKYLAELEVFRGQEEGLEIDIINPSIILSQTDWNRSSAQLFKYVWRSRPFYTEGSINYVDVRDVVKLILTITNVKARGNRIIANGGAISTKDFLSEVAKRFNKKQPWINVPTPLISIVARMEFIRSILTGNEPIVTAQSARTAHEKLYYSNQKALTVLKTEFRTLEQTLDWCCPYYLQNATINN